MFLIGENFLLAVVFYGGLLWLAGIALAVMGVITLLYGYTWFDRSEIKGNRSWAALRSWRCCRRYQRCYGHRVIVDPDAFTETRVVPCIYAASPHGVNAVSYIATFLIQRGDHVRLFSPNGLRCGVWSGMFWPILLRELALALGCVSVREKALRKQLFKLKRDVAIIPGGMWEIAPPDDFIPKAQPGFLRIAWEAQGNVDCAHVYHHGEEENYCTIGRNWWIRKWLIRRLGATLTFYAGAFCHHPLTTFISTRHRWRDGESFDDFCQRWRTDDMAHRARWLRGMQEKKET